MLRNLMVCAKKTGHVNWDQVGQAALTGAVSGGLNNFVGSAFQPGTLSKIVAHGVVGGINSSMNKGNFWNGFGTGAFAEYTSGTVDKIDTLNKGFSAARVVAAGVIGGTASSIGGGNFGQGFMIGSFQRAFNHEFDGHKKGPWIDSKGGNSPEENMRKTGEVLKRVYNRTNDIVHSDYALGVTECYLTLAPWAGIAVPGIWATIPAATTFLAYQKMMPFGAKFPEWE